MLNYHVITTRLGILSYLNSSSDRQRLNLVPDHDLLPTFQSLKSLSGASFTESLLCFLSPSFYPGSGGVVRFAFGAAKQCALLFMKTKDRNLYSLTILALLGHLITSV